MEVNQLLLLWSHKLKQFLAIKIIKYIRITSGISGGDALTSFLMLAKGFSIDFLGFWIVFKERISACFEGTEDLLIVGWSFSSFVGEFLKEVFWLFSEEFVLVSTILLYSLLSILIVLFLIVGVFRLALKLKLSNLYLFLKISANLFKILNSKTVYKFQDKKLTYFYLNFAILLILLDSLQVVASCAQIF